MMLSRRQRLQIAARSSVDDRSIQRVYAGKPVRGATRRRVEEAARTLGLSAPGVEGDDSSEMEDFAREVREGVRLLAPLLAGVDSHDLDLIVERRVRLHRWDRRQRFFIRRSPEGHYVF